MSIGTNIKRLREERKFTQEQVADALDVSFQAVSAWERNEYRPDIDKLIRLAELFDVSVSAIAANPKAALVKCIDRCNNLTTMSWGLSRERIYRMITETELYFPKLLKVIKAEPEYSNASWLLQYQMESMLDIYKRLM